MGLPAKPMARVWKELLAEAVQVGECLLIEKGHSTGIGYKRRSADNKTWYVHQIADQMARGPAPEGIVLTHICDRPNCINSEHIKRGTHYRTRLTIEQVRKIREAQGTYAELGRKFGIGRGAIHNIKSGRTWRLSQ